MRKALILGISGQDGSYLAEILLDRGYEVHGTMRRSSAPNTQRIDHIFDKLRLHYADLIDASRIERIVAEIKPDEVYNLAAQSHVGISYQMPEYTCAVTGMGALNVFEAVKRYAPEAHVYQASSSEMFGETPAPQHEGSAFRPVSPYGCAKLFAHHIANQYRRDYGINITCGILFNHESPRRGINFVTRKITRGLAGIKLGKASTLKLGNLDAMRDWGYAKEYAEFMADITAKGINTDLVVGTGESYSVRKFLEACLRFFGLPVGVVSHDPSQVRPSEVWKLQADATKARTEYGWNPKTTMNGLGAMMCEHDLKEAANE